MLNGMRIPSVRTLMNRLELSRKQAQELRTLARRDRHATVLNRTNDMLAGYGVESIGLPEGCFARCEAPEVDIHYVNRGDTYATTLLIVNGRYRVGSWGDEVEAYDNRR